MLKTWSLDLGAIKVVDPLRGLWEAFRSLGISP
jgi:hypothetical protein